MKKTLALLICITLITALFTSCRQTTYRLSESEIDKLYEDEETKIEYPHPSAAEITGQYLITGVDSNGQTQTWNANLRSYDGKLIIQVKPEGSTISDLTDELIEQVTSSYDEAEGHFVQSFSSEEYTSNYEAYFYIIEDGRIKIEIINQYVTSENSEGTVGITGEGFKVADFEETDENETSEESDSEEEED